MRRVLVTGSRDFPYKEVVFDALQRQYNKENARITVVHGDCPTGADAFAKEWTKMNPDLGIEEAHPADWSLGRSAGFRRNAEMIACQADVVLGFRMNLSKGTSHTLGLAQEAKIPSVTYDLYQTYPLPEPKDIRGL
jgi:hypothetical protein